MKKILLAVALLTSVGVYAQTETSAIHTSSDIDGGITRKNKLKKKR